MLVTPAQVCHGPNHILCMGHWLTLHDTRGLCFHGWSMHSRPQTMHASCHGCVSLTLGPLSPGSPLSPGPPGPPCVGGKISVVLARWQLLPHTVYKNNLLLYPEGRVVPWLPVHQVFPTWMGRVCVECGVWCVHVCACVWCVHVCACVWCVDVCGVCIYASVSYSFNFSQI